MSSNVGRPFTSRGRQGGPFVVKTRDGLDGFLLMQRTASGSAGNVLVQRINGVVTIQGHMWPLLRAVGPWRPDGELEAKLHTLDDGKDPLPVHRYARIATAGDRRVEIHEALCLHTDVDSIGPTAQPPHVRPCLDARTGEDLTPHLVGWKLSATNGHVTDRALVHLVGP